MVIQLKKFEIVGIPRSLLYHTYGKLWLYFFDNLNINYILSPKTNKKILNRGIKLTNSEACLSLKLYMGHVDYLKNKCDILFIPRIGKIKKNEIVCTNFNALYDITRNTFPDIKILHYNIDCKKHKSEYKEFIRLGHYFNKSTYESTCAYFSAKKKIKENEKNIISDNNVFDVVCDINKPVAEYLSNKDLLIGDCDIYIGGHINIGTATTNAIFNTFTGKTGSVNIGSVTIKDYDAFGAIRLSALDADYVRINGVKSRPINTPTSACRAVNVGSTVAIGRLDITNVDATHPTGASVSPSIDANALLNATIIDCSWQPRFRGFVSTLPTTGTYVRGDTLQKLSPNSGQPLEWVCVVGNSTGGAWRLSKYVANKSTTSNRPTLSFNDIGVLYFDTTLASDGKPIWWTGSVWVDSTGTQV